MLFIYFLNLTFPYFKYYKKNRQQENFVRKCLHEFAIFENNHLFTRQCFELMFFFQSIRRYTEVNFSLPSVELNVRIYSISPKGLYYEVPDIRLFAVGWIFINPIGDTHHERFTGSLLF